MTYQSVKTSGIRINLYIYDLGIKNIKDGIKSKEVEEVFSQAEQDIFDGKKSGVYKKVIKNKKEVISLSSSNSHKAIYGDYTIHVKKVKYNSVLIVTGYKKNFIKFRISYDKEKEGIAGPSTLNFVENIGKLLE